MELKVMAVATPEAPSFNYEELKAELLQKASMYASVVYTEDQIKEAKADRANLNRLKKALNDERIRRERDYMKPFEDFKGKIAEIISIIDKPISVIDQQIKAAEERQKEDKFLQIENFWNSCVFPCGITLNQIMDQKWLNASVSMKSIQETIEARLQQIEKDLAVVRSLPTFAFEAEQAYLSTLDLARAVSEAHRLQEMADKKAAYEAQKAAATPPGFSNLKPGDSVSFVGATETAADLPTEPLREWVRFQALMTVDEAKALGQYLRSQGIKYKSV